MEIATKVIAVLAGLFGFYKIFADVVFARSIKRRDEYKLVKSFIEDIDNDDSHPFVLEKGFLALTGLSISVLEIRYLLSFPNPNLAANIRPTTCRSIEFDEKCEMYSFKGLYKKKNYRNTAPLTFLSLYVLFFLLAGYFAFFNSFETFTPGYVPLVSVAFAIVSVASLNKSESLKDELALMHMQDKKNEMELDEKPSIE